MIAYLTQERNQENENLPLDCPWTSWNHTDGQPLPENAILVSEEEFALIYAEYEPIILKEKDRITMKKRAEVKDSLIGQIGADNKERLRNGVWTQAQLIEFLGSEECKLVLGDIQGLSFELAQGKIMAMTNPLITIEIKTTWINILKENMFL